MIQWFVLQLTYGLTEASTLVTHTPLDEPLETKVSTVGKVYPHTEVRIAVTSLREKTKTNVRSNQRPVHKTPEKFENAALFQRLGLHTNPSRKRSFSKTLCKQEEFLNAGFALSADEKYLMHFQSEISIFNFFFWCNVDGA